MLATKGKQTATKGNPQLEQAKTKANSVKPGLGTKAELDASFVPYLLNRKPEAQPEGPGSPKAAADPSAVTESVKDAKYEEVKGEAFVKGANEKAEADPSDVKQGSLGNCYLMAGLAAIANTDPDVLKNMIKDNGDGTYTVTFYLKENRIGVFSSGSKVSITVTNQFPMRNGQPAFAKKGDSGNSGPELWVMLIEKAWAVHQGSYEDSRGSKVKMDTDIMAYMTGKKSESVYCSSTSESEMLKKMLAANEGGHPMTAGMPQKTKVSDDVTKAAEEKGLYFNHAYTVMSVDKEGKNIILRNPWGSSDPKSMTTADVKKIFNYVTINAA
ncbi:MAG: C2 family cysteine protease [Myxococcota bacterium]|jgi:hypothetical protein|nr:C2 family cysteine protease [Myxococcota bacterium]